MKDASNIHALPARHIGKFFVYTILALVCLIVGLGYIHFAVRPLFSFAAAVSWDGGGVGDDWCTAGNWSDDTLPTSEDAVTIDAAVTVTNSGCAAGDVEFSTLTIGGSNAAVVALSTGIGTATDITVANNGTLQQLTSSTVSIAGTLLVESGGLLTHGNNTTTHQYSVNVRANVVTINAGGSVNVDALGFKEYSNSGLAGVGYGPGGGKQLGGSNWRGSGAGHGGYGGASQDAPLGGAPYCDITGPTTLGSGGAGYYTGGDGGGHISLVATSTVTINGIITADGANGVSSYASGGAGGSINIVGATIAGTPSSFTITGGNGKSSTTDGGSGGGCAYIGYTNSSSIDPSASYVAMNGGAGYEHGGAGIIFSQKVATNGDLYVYNNGTVGTSTPQSITNATFDTVSIGSGALYTVTSSDALIVVSSTPFGGNKTGYIEVRGSLEKETGTIDTVENVTVRVYSGGSFDNGTTLTILDDGGLAVFGGGIVSSSISSLTTSGTLDIYQGALATIDDLTMTSGTTTMRNFTSTTAFTFGDIVMNSGALLTHPQNTATETTAPFTHDHVLNIRATNVTIDSGASIDLDGKGHIGVTNTGAGTGNGYGRGTKGSGGNYGGSGGSHAGAGGESTYADDPVGPTYCNTSSPATIGSSGVGYYGAGDGGGLLMLAVTSTVTINGTITADGTKDTVGTTAYAPGGAGGGVNITADVIAGTPESFTATGADGTGATYGTGGGGCMYLRYTSTNSISSGDVSVAGGSIGFEAGGAGSFVSEIPYPSPPTSLYVDESDASAGGANPSDLVSLTPVFSAQCNSVDNCITAEIQVDDSSDFSSPVWESGVLDIADVDDGVRISDITYAGGQLVYNTTYYWRIRMSSDLGTGGWSSGTNTFSAPRFMELFSFNNGGAVQQGAVETIEWGSIDGEADETVLLEYSTDNFVVDVNTIVASVTSTASSTEIKSVSWTIPEISSATVKVRVSSNNDGNNYAVVSENTFTVQAGAVSAGSEIKTGRTFGTSSFYTFTSNTVFTGGNAQMSDSGAWYNASWTKRKELVITNNTTITLTNISVEVPITYDGDMQVDFDDIRFTSDDKQTLLDHWIEVFVTSTSATAWIEVPSIEASASTTVYLYYGNGDAMSGSSAAETFLFADDFSDDLDTDSKWTVNGTPTTSNGYLLLDDDQDGIWATNYEYGYNEIIEARVRRTESGSIDGRLQVANQASRFTANIASGGRAMAVWHYYSGNNVYAEYSAGDRGYQSFGAADTNWRQYKIIWKSGISASFFYDTTEKTASVDNTIPEESDQLHPELYAHYDGMDVDWVTVRAYLTSDPTVEIGAEVDVSSENNDAQSISFKTGHVFTDVSSFSAVTSTSGSGAVTFRVTNDPATSTWYYCVGDTLTTSTAGITHTNIADEITDVCLDSLSAGTFNVETYLIGDLGDTAQVSSVSFIIDNNTPPTSTLGVPLQTSASVVTVTTTMSDTESNVTSLHVEYSLDGSTWSSTTFSNVSASTGTVSTVTGTISSIDTNVTTTVTLTIGWDIGIDVPDTEDTTVYIRVTPVDASAASGVVSSSAFTIDTKSPTAPGDIAANAVTTSTVTFIFPGVQSSDTNFSEYKVHYSTSSPVLSSDSALTSSTDVNLSATNFNGQETSDALTGLTPNQRYYFHLFAYDSWGNVTSSAAAITTTTNPIAPGLPSAMVSTTTQLDLTWNSNGNGAGTVYQLYNITSSTVVATTTDTTYSVTGLAGNTSYQFKVRAEKTGDAGVYGEYSPDSLGVYTLASPVSAFSATNATNTTTIQLLLAWTHVSQDGMLLDRDNGCDGSYDVTLFDNPVANESTPTTTATSLSANTCYVYRIRSYNGDGVINNITSSTSGEITTPPAQPTNLTTLNVEETNITWEWDAVANATGYYMYNNTTGALIDTIIGATNYLHNGLSVNTLYEVIVRAYHAVNGIGIGSSPANAVTDSSVPTGLTVSSRTTSTLSWTWTDGGQSSFYARDANNIADNSGFVTTTAWTQTDLDANTAYSVEVKGRNASSTDTAYSGSVARYTAQYAPTSVTLSSTTANSITATVAGTFPNNGIGSSVIHFDNGAGTTQEITTGTTWTNSGLSANTEYTYAVYATNGDGTETSSTAASVYTLANTPTKIATSLGDDSTSLVLTLGANSNPSATTDVLIYATTTGAYVDTAARTLSGDATDFVTFDVWGSPTTVTGLSANTCYQFQARAKNGDDILTASSTVSDSVCTRANIPTGLTITIAGTTQITTSWGVNGNPAGTEYYVEETTGSTNSGWITGTSYTFTNLRPGGTYTFRVKARNFDSIETNYVSDTGATQQNGAFVVRGAPLPVQNDVVVLEIVEGDVGAPGEANNAEVVYRITNGSEESIEVKKIHIDSDESEEVITRQLSQLPVVEATVISGAFNPGTGVSVETGSSGAHQTHSVVLRGVTGGSVGGRAQYSVYSTRQDFELKEGEDMVVDVDADGVADLHIYAKTIDTKTGKVQTVVTNLAAFTFAINNNMSYTTSTVVSLRIRGYDNVTHMAISEEESFTNVSFIPFTPFVTYTFVSEVLGGKTLYVRLLTEDGYIAEVQDSIVLTPSFGICPLATEFLYRTSPTGPIYFVTHACKKTVLTDDALIRTYISDPAYIALVRKGDVDGIPDATGVVSVPRGPLYRPGNGSLIKTLAEPNVYFLFHNRYHWIASEEVFTGLKFLWSWIEEVSQTFIELREAGQDIGEGQGHLPGTVLVETSTRQYYVLAPHPANPDFVIKRPIEDMRALQELGYRQDRVIEMEHTDQYPYVGEPIVASYPRISLERDLHVGMSGEDVRALQELLLALGWYEHDEITGYYGVKTREAVAAYQHANGLDVTGLVTEETRRQLARE